MDTRQYMIVDLERRGDKRMFITEQVSFISENKTVYGLFGSRHLLACSITTKPACSILLIQRT